MGDLQGCSEPFRRLRERIGFRPGRDRLWLVGDLVNRGPDSLGVLRWVRRHAEDVTAVLGNHDLHLLATAAGRRRPGKRDTLAPVLAADDRDDLLAWLAGLPLLHREPRDAGGEHVLVHAGLHPRWTVDDAEEHAREVEAALGADGGAAVWEALALKGAPAWSDGLAGTARLASALAVLTRYRTCTPDGAPCEGFNGPPAEAPAGCVPWFEVEDRASRDATVVFGHWAALGFHRGPGVLALDSGCVWGGALTAVRLEDGEVFREPATPDA